MKIKLVVSLALLLVSKNFYAQSLPELIKNGNAKIAASDFAGAEKDFANAIKVNVKVVDTYLEKLKKYSAMNEYQRSTSDMPDGFVYKHDLAVPYYGHGLALAGMGKQNDALSDFEKALQIDPKYSDVFCERGIILIKKGDKDKGCIDLLNAKIAGSEKAKDLYNKSVCSDMSTNFITSGNTKFNSKDYINALADYNYAVQLNSELVVVYLQRGICLMALKKYDKALADFSKALKIDPNDMVVLFNRGCAYNALENFKEAFNDFSVLVKKNPNDYDSYMQRGIACEGLQNSNSAIYDYTEAIRIKPSDGMAYYKRGLVSQDIKGGTSCKDFKMAASLGVDDAKNLANGCEKVVEEPETKGKPKTTKKK